MDNLLKSFILLIFLGFISFSINAAEKPTTVPDSLIYFHASWCGYCKQQGPILKQIKAYNIIKVDVDKPVGIVQIELLKIKKMLAQSGLNEAKGIPGFFILKNSTLIRVFSGVKSLEYLKKELSLLDSVLK